MFVEVHQHRSFGCETKQDQEEIEQERILEDELAQKRSHERRMNIAGK